MYGVILTEGNNFTSLYTSNQWAYDVVRTKC